MRARVALHYAIKTGKIIKPEFCGRCQLSGIIHAHHSNYSEHLEVRWRCRKCHSIEHALLNQMEREHIKKMAENRLTEYIKSVYGEKLNKT